MRPQPTTNDLYLALGVTLVGGLLLFLAMRAHFSPQDVNPGIEGTLVAGVLGTILVLLQPLAYRRALFFTAPVVALQYWACAYAGGPAAGIVGLHLLIIGFIGLGLALREPSPAPARKPAAARATAQPG
jgi:hypothetical protein